MARVITEFVFSGRAVVVEHVNIIEAYEYVDRVLYCYPNTVQSVSVRSSRRDDNVLLGIIKRRKKAS